MTLAIVNVVAFVLVLAALVLSVRRPMHATEEGRAVLVLLSSLLLLSSVGLVRRTDHHITDDLALAGWTAIAAVAVWVMTQRR